MGIKGMNKFLRNNCPDIFEPIHISEFAFKKVAIDISLYLCKFKTVCGDHWITAFINLVACLRRNEIHCVFIYDTGSPPEKAAERAARREQQAKADQKVRLLEDALEHYHMTNEVQQILTDLNEKKKEKVPPRLMTKTKNGIDMVMIEQEISRLRQQILDISPEDFALTKELFDILKVPYYQAPLEAETTCADLCKRGLVDAVLSEDTDVLAYGSPIFLSKIDTATDNCVRINHSDMLESLELNYEEFLDLCIMCGTDYNKNIFRIGPEKSYTLITQHRSIDEIENKTTNDTSILNHIRGRELFKDYERFEVVIPYCGTPNFEDLSMFVIKHNIRVNLETLRTAFIHNILVFDDESEDTQPLSDTEECKDLSKKLSV
jgi:5'-3' exonuclease